MTIEFGNAVRTGWQKIGIAGEVELYANIECDLEQLIAFLKADAAEALGPGLRYEIRKSLPINYGRSGGMAWYRQTSMDDAPEWQEGLRPERSMDEFNCYYLIGRFVTPADAKGKGKPLDDTEMMPMMPAMPA